jgi:hypothetical protein
MASAKAIRSISRGSTLSLARVDEALALLDAHNMRSARDCCARPEDPW